MWPQRFRNSEVPTFRYPLPAAPVRRERFADETEWTIARRPGIETKQMGTAKVRYPAITEAIFRCSLGTAREFDARPLGLLFRTVTMPQQ